ncbi:MAG: CoA-binding protein [Alphaproteobacteria bacterium]|nr:CoA-binding protein [Alphaproteobacteria bacterium]
MPRNSGVIDLESLEAFFRPNSVAIIGASSDATKIGGRPINNMKIAGYRGGLYPVNPNYPEIQGIKAYPTLGAIKQPVDMAVIVVPAPLVVKSVQDCIDHGVKAAIILSSGFAEIDEKGAREQTLIGEMAAAAGLRVMGPNCMGTMNARTGMIATFSSGLIDRGPQSGGISIASQSGAFGAHCFILARERGYGLNLWATMGNQVDVEFADCLAFMARDPATDVVLGYMEGIRDPRKLVEALAVAKAYKKPVVLMKVGKSDVGSAAAQSHTASLTGSDAVFDALLRQYDVHRAATIDELFDVAYACTAKKFPTEKQLGIITVSGGVGVIMADAAADAGLDLPPLPEATQRRLKKMVPFAGTRNPLDVTAQLLNDTSLMQPMFEALLTEGGYPAALCFVASLGLNPMMMERLQPAMEGIARKYSDRLLVLSILARPEVRQSLEALGYLCYEDPSRAVHAIAALTRFGQAFADTRVAKPPPRLPRGAPALHAGQSFNEVDAKRLLAAAGIPVVEEVIATTSAAAARAAAKLGFPVVMKIVSADIQHKSEIGGVLLNVASRKEAEAGFTTLMRRAKKATPKATLDGVLIAPMIKGGIETIIGVQRDPVFGPVVMFGLGGIFVEVFKDVTFRIAPFGLDVAHAMIREVKGYALLKGARGHKPADVNALARALAQTSVFAAKHADALESIDLNPFIVRAKGEGALAVDALVITRP